MFEAFEYNHLTGVRRSWWARFIMWARNFCPTHHVPMWLYERGFGGVWVCDECDKERNMNEKTSDWSPQEQAAGQVELTLENLAKIMSYIRRDLDQLTGVHNAVSGELAQHKKQMHDWHIEVYQFVLTVSNRLQQLEEKYNLAFAQTTGTGYMSDAYKSYGVLERPGGAEPPTRDLEIEMLTRDAERWRKKYLALWAKFVDISRIMKEGRKSKDAD